jgi:uncharacterized protein (TIGR02300 family)
MAAKDLGTKYTCFKCSTKFYDMKKPDPLCPKCGADQRESPALKAPEKPARGRRAAPIPVPVQAEPVLEEEEIEDAGLEDEDASDLPDDDDDL